MSSGHDQRDLPVPVTRLLRSRGPALVRVKRVACRELFRTKVQAAAAAHGSTVELDLAPDVHVAPSVHVEVWPSTRTRVRLGPGTILGAGASLSLRGGVLETGSRVELRRLVTVDVEGDLRLGDGVIISTAATLHCKESIHIDTLTIVGEFSTIIDSTHLRTPPGVPIHHHVAAAPVTIGSNCWFGAGCVVTSGVTIGDQAVVGAKSVVTKDVRPGYLVLGAPAKEIREVTSVDVLE